MFLIVEVLIVIAILLLIWFSLEHDHEGEWVDVATGEKFMITSVEGGWTATSPLRSVAITRACAWAPFRTPDRVGTYDRWAGLLKWQSNGKPVGLPVAPSQWTRISTCAGRHALNWLTARNLTRTWTLEGDWLGESSGTPIYLQIGQVTSLRTGSAVEILQKEPMPDGLLFTNALKEQLAFSWGGSSRATLDIHNGKVAMSRLDGAS